MNLKYLILVSGFYKILRLFVYIVYMKKVNVYMMVGLPKSGKSTYLKKHYPTLPVVSRDIAKATLGYTKSKMTSLSNEDEDKVTNYLNMQYTSHVLHGEDFVIDNANINHQNRLSDIKFLQGLGAKVTLIFIDTPFDKCVARCKNNILLDYMKRCNDMFKIKPSPNEADNFIHIVC